MAPTIAPTFDNDPNRENCIEKDKAKQHQASVNITRGQWESNDGFTSESERPRSAMMASCVGEE